MMSKQPKFLDRKQPQKYAFSYVELTAHMLLANYKMDKYSAFAHDNWWLRDFRHFSALHNNPTATGLKKLNSDVEKGRVADLNSFYTRFNKLVKSKRGKALKLEKRRLAGRLGALERVGESGVNNPNLFHAIYVCIDSVTHTGVSRMDLDEALSAIIKEHHQAELSNSQRQTLFSFMTERLELMEQQVNKIEAELIRRADTISGRALFLYGLVRMKAEVGGEVVFSLKQLADLSPYSKDTIKPAMELLVSLGALDIIEQGKPFQKAQDTRYVNGKVIKVGAVTSSNPKASHYKRLV